MPEVWGQNTFLAFVRSALNDPAGPYYEALKLAEERPAIVSAARRVAAALYADKDSGPVVFSMLGPGENTSSGKTIGGTFYEGQRVGVTLKLDMGVNDASPEDPDEEEDNVADEAAMDAMLGGFVRDIVRRGFAELAALGLNNIAILPDEENQRAGVGRNPHIVTFFVKTVDNWTP